MEQRINQRMNEQFNQIMEYIAALIGNQNRGHHNREQAYDTRSVGEEKGEFYEEEAPRGRYRVGA